MKCIAPSVDLSPQALDGSSAPIHPELILDGIHMPFGSTATHDPAGLEIRDPEG
ncbi:MAG: hypothetical protein QXI22_00895 [Sulfolobales archaeon]